MTNEQKEQTANGDRNNFVYTKSRGNTVMTDTLESLENTRILSRHPACEVRVSFAAEPDEVAIADVLRMLMSTGSRR